MSVCLPVCLPAFVWFVDGTCPDMTECLVVCVRGVWCVWCVCVVCVWCDVYGMCGVGCDGFYDVCGGVMCGYLCGGVRAVWCVRYGVSWCV